MHFLLAFSFWRWAQHASRLFQILKYGCPFQTGTNLIHYLTKHLRPFTSGTKAAQIPQGFVNLSSGNGAVDCLLVQILQRLLTLHRVGDVIRDYLPRACNIAGCRDLVCELLVELISHLRRRLIGSFQSAVHCAVVNRRLILLRRHASQTILIV